MHPIGVGIIAIVLGALNCRYTITYPVTQFYTLVDEFAGISLQAQLGGASLCP